MTRALEDRAVIVTGAARGLGRAYAIAAAQQGAAVVVADIDAVGAAAVASEIAVSGGYAVSHAASVSAAGTGEALVQLCRDAFGTVDGLINNAGILSPGLATEQDAATIRHTIDTNVTGVINCGTAAMRAMSGRGGAIVNIVSGALLGSDRLALYGATKAAVLGLTYGWALEGAKIGVRVNALAPLAWTDMSNEMGGDDAGKGGAADAIAPAAVYLLSDRSAALNGQVLRADGTQLALMAPPAFTHAVPGRDWNLDTIDEALAGRLSVGLAPVGLGAGAPAMQV